MYPDLLEIFGVTLHGIMFERILWLLIALLMIWGIISSVIAIYKGRKAEGIIQCIIVFVILIWSGLSFLKTFQPNYSLVFENPLVIHTYAFCILIGVTLGTLTTMKMAKDRGDDPKEMARLCILLIILGFLGARAAHVIVEFSSYWNSCFHPELAGLNESNCLRALNFGEGGLTFYGGVIAGMIVMTVFFVRRKKRNQPIGILSVLDKLAAALAISHALGRIGCLAAGCCWGAITTGTIGLTYGKESFAFAELVKRPELHEMMLKTGETPLLHATQIYEAVGELILFGLLWLMHKKKAKPGRMVGCWFACYGILRFIVEFMRDDAERGYYFEKSIKTINEIFLVPADHATILSTSQGIAIVMTVIGLGVLISTLFKKHSAAQPEMAVSGSPSNQISAPAPHSDQSPSAPMAAPAAGRSPSSPVSSPMAAPAAGRSPSRPVSSPMAAPAAGRSPSRPVSSPMAATTAVRSPSRPVSAPMAAPTAGRSPSRPVSAPMAAPTAGRSPSRPVSAPMTAPSSEEALFYPASSSIPSQESISPTTHIDLAAAPVPPSSYSSARLKPVISAPASPSQSNNPALGLSQSPKIIPAKTQAMFDLPEPVDLSGDLPSVTDMQPHLEPPEDFEEESIQSHPFEEESIQSHQKDGLALATDNWSGDEDEFLDDFIENDEEALYGEKTTISLESAFYEGEDEEDNDVGSGKTPSESSGETKGFLGLFKKPKIIPASEKSKR